MKYLLILAALALAGCGGSSDETAGEKLDAAVESAGDMAEDAADKAGEMAETAGDMAEDAADKAGEMAEAAGFRLIGKSEINANPKDTRDHPKGVWTLPPSLRLKDRDKQKYLAIGESDRMTLKFVKPAE